MSATEQSNPRVKFRLSVKLTAAFLGILLTAVLFEAMARIERIVDEFDSNGSTVVLATLPGLFTVTEKPTPKDLKIGHLPEFTENPNVLAKLTERYNAALRALAARRGLGVIDLEKSSVSAVKPREVFSLDSVHLTARRLEMIGFFMADQLIGRLEKL